MSPARLGVGAAAILTAAFLGALANVSPGEPEGDSRPSDRAVAATVPATGALTIPPAADASARREEAARALEPSAAWIAAKAPSVTRHSPPRWLRVELFDSHGAPWAGDVRIPDRRAQRPLPASWDQAPEMIVIPVDRSAPGSGVAYDAVERRLHVALADGNAIEYDARGLDAVMVAAVGGDPQLGYFDGEVRVVDTSAPGFDGTVRVEATLPASALGHVEVRTMVTRSPRYGHNELMNAAVASFFEAEGSLPPAQPWDGLDPGALVEHPLGPFTHTVLVVYREGWDLPLLALSPSRKRPGAGSTGDEGPLWSCLPAGRYSVRAWNPPRTHGRMYGGGAFGEGALEVVAGTTRESVLELDGGTVLDIDVGDLPSGIRGATFTFIDADGAEHRLVRERTDFHLSVPSFTSSWPANTRAVSEPIPLLGSGRLRTELWPDGPVTEEPAALERGLPLRIRR